MASPMTIKRIHREIADLKKEDLGSITLEPTGESLFKFKGTIPGPQGSIYEGGVFRIGVELAGDYPFSAPKVMFETRIYHMNISERGNVCLDILKHNWSPALSLFKVMLSLSSLLTDPNPQDPLIPAIAQQYMKNRRLHDSTARQWTETYARPPPPPPPSAPAKKSAKGKGKEKVTDEDTITISDDEDDEPLPVRRSKRKATEAEVVDISDDGDEDTATSGRNSRKRPRAPAPRSAAVSGEVIVLDDD